MSGVPSVEVLGIGEIGTVEDGAFGALVLKTDAGEMLLKISNAQLGGLQAQLSNLNSAMHEREGNATGKMTFTSVGLKSGFAEAPQGAPVVMLGLQSENGARQHFHMPPEAAAYLANQLLLAEAQARRNAAQQPPSGS